MNVIKYIVFGFNSLLLFYFLLVCSIYIILNVIAFFKMIKYNSTIKYLDLKRVFKLTNYKPISVIVPAYNEENGIVESIKSLLQLEYPDFQLIVVNDGSKDSTLQKLFENFSIRQVSFTPFYKLKSQPIRSVFMSSEYPNLIVIDKVNGGKADAINAGVNLAKSPLITVIDADSVLERDCLLKIVRPFMEDENVIAVGGTIRIANGCNILHGNILEVGLAKSWLARFQVVEYLRAFLFGRNGFDVLNGILIISGAFSCFSRDALIKIDGYREGCIGEDMEIIVRMHRKLRRENPKLRITFIPDPVCWTEAPETFAVLRSQRMRWQKGTVDSILLHKKLFMNPAYGWIGMLVFPYFALFEMIGPIIEIFGYFFFIVSFSLGFVTVSFAVAFLTTAILYGVVLSVLSVILEELSFQRYPKLSHLLTLMAAAFLENFGYRQITTWWRFRGMVEYFTGKRHWGQMEKKGFAKK